MTKVKQLEKKFGGRWKYRGSSYWECLDDNRAVWAVSGCSCDDECCDVPARYYLYGDGTPKEVYWENSLVNLKLCKGPKI